MGRFRLEPASNGPYNPYYGAQQIQIISNLLNSPNCSNELAEASHAAKFTFKLKEVGGIRSTSGLFVRYIGSDSNGVERVASNACFVVERFYSTNDPAVRITYWGTSAEKPTWQQDLEYWLWRAGRIIGP